MGCCTRRSPEPSQPDPCLRASTTTRPPGTRSTPAARQPCSTACCTNGSPMGSCRRCSECPPCPRMCLRVFVAIGNRTSSNRRLPGLRCHSSGALASSVATAHFIRRRASAFGASLGRSTAGVGVVALCNPWSMADTYAPLTFHLCGRYTIWGHASDYAKGNHDCGHEPSAGQAGAHYRISGGGPRGTGVGRTGTPRLCSWLEPRIGGRSAL